MFIAIEARDILNLPFPVVMASEVVAAFVSLILLIFVAKIEPSGSAVC